MLVSSHCVTCSIRYPLLMGWDVDWNHSVCSLGVGRSKARKFQLTAAKMNPCALCYSQETQALRGVKRKVNQVLL